MKLLKIECIYEHQTDKAYLVTPTGMKKGTWVSKQYSELVENDPQRGEEVTLEVEDWFAEKIGLV